MKLILDYGMIGLVHWGLTPQQQSGSYRGDDGDDDDDDDVDNDDDDDEMTLPLVVSRRKLLTYGTMV